MAVTKSNHKMQTNEYEDIITDVSDITDYDNIRPTRTIVKLSFTNAVRYVNLPHYLLCCSIENELIFIKMHINGASKLLQIYKNNTAHLISKCTYNDLQFLILNSFICYDNNIMRSMSYCSNMLKNLYYMSAYRELEYLSQSLQSIDINKLLVKSLPFENENLPYRTGYNFIVNDDPNKESCCIARAYFNCFLHNHAITRNMPLHLISRKSI
jgi:hypothetical protein